MKRCLLIMAAVALVGTTGFAATTADVIVVVDESGSMGGEHAWIATMIGSLDTELIAAGITGNRYGLVGFGASSGHGIEGHQHAVGGGQFGTAAQFATAAGGLVTSGGLEDGYDGIDEALGYSFRAGAAVNIILVTDEDRDVADGSEGHTYANILAALGVQNALLNAVIDGTFAPANGGGTSPLGVDAAGNAYYADGLGGYTSAAGGTFSSGFGTTGTDYVDLAWDTGGAAWNLNFLRAGGTTADSFTAAFVDIKVSEIEEQEPSAVPLPAAGWAGIMMLGGLGLIGRMRRRRRDDA